MIKRNMMDSKVDVAPTRYVRSRSGWLWAWAAGSIAAIVIAFAIGTQVHSPWESAAENARFQATVTGRAEMREFTTDQEPIVGEVSLGSERTVTAQNASASRSVVTAVGLASGDVLRPGEVLAEVSGRPVIALELPFPLYRDLRPGDAGPDVRAVQQALANLGVHQGVADGKYGARTAEAVARLYERAEASAPQATTEKLAAVESAEEAVDSAEMTEPSDPRAMAAARVGLESARFDALTPLPLGEILAVGATGASVTSIAAVGTDLGDGTSPLATLRSGVPTVTARVAVDQAGELTPGGKTVVTSTLDGRSSVEGTVAVIGPFEAMASDSGAPPGRDIVIALDPDAAFDDGASVLITPDGAEQVVEGLSVPLVAVREDSAGAFVLRTNDDSEVGTRPMVERVPVTVTMVGEGYALIEPGKVRAGDVVVISEAQ